MSRASRQYSRSCSLTSRAESQISMIDKPEMMEGETKAQYFWRLLRTCVISATDVMKKADVKDLVIIHGIHHNRRINHVEKITQVLTNKQTKDYLTVDGKFIRIYKADGRKKDLVTPEEPMNRMMYASQTQQFVGWSYNQEPILLMNQDFEVISSSKAPGPVLAAVYNDQIGEVVTAGAGFLTTWVFRYGGRHLLPRRTVREGLTADHTLSLLVVEETPSRAQKAYAAWGTNVDVFNLYSGELLSTRKDLHVRSITALLFFNPLKYLITAARDGSIKVWDDTWHLQLVFVGHCDIVNCMAVYPYGPMILSASNDCTVRLWSLETCDEIDCLDTPDPVTSLGTQYNQTTVHSQCDYHADLWKVQQIHTLHSTIGHRVVSIKQTSHPSFPIRSVLLCKDSSVRIITPPTGDIITTLLMDPRNKLIDAAYAVGEGTLFAVFDNGTIVKADTMTNPCTITDVWKYPEAASQSNFLLVYEYVIEAELEGGNIWDMIKRSVTTRSLKAAANAPKKHSNRTLLLGGRKDGYLCVFNWDNGEVDFEIEAHGNKGVLNMIANSKRDQLISAGYDNIIKVWRLYPFAQEALTPLMSFYCTHLPLHMTVMKMKLMVAFQDHPTATYQVVLYNLEDKNRHDHAPHDDHTDSISGLSVCPKLKLFASSSLDGTVRIWNESNNIVRVLKLNATPHSVGFCSQRGDLVVGIGEHLHHIDYRTYMPKAYRHRMISMQFAEVHAEKAVEYDMNRLKVMNPDDVSRLKAARSSFKFLHFNDILTDEESNLVNKEKEDKDLMFSMLAAREAEIARIRDGDLHAKKKPKPTKVTKREAFNKYLKIFYNRPKLEMPKEHPFFQEGFSELHRPPEEPEVDDEYEEEPEPTGFFPGPKRAKKTLPPTPPSTEKPPDKPLQPGYAINPSGFIPNSILVKLLWPEESRPKPKPQEPYRPPTLTASQLRSLSSKKETSNWQRSLILDYDDDEEEKKSEVFEDEAEERLSEEGLETGSKSSLMAKLQQVLDKPPSPKEPEEDVSPEGTPPGGSAVELDTSAAIAAVGASDGTEVDGDSGGSKSNLKKPSKTKAAPTPRKPIVKFVSRPKPPSPPPPAVVRAPVKVREKTPSPPPPPPTPLPDFILQFKGLDWFEQYFPNCNENTMPKPWSTTAFVTMLLRVMRVGEYPVKVAVAEAIILIKQTEDDLTNADAICKCVQSIFNHHASPPSCLNTDEKAFIIVGIKLMTVMGQFTKEYFIEMIVQFLDADKEVRTLVMSTLKSSGLKDPHDLLVKELDSWDVWNIDEDTRQRELRKICDDWLTKWMTMFKIHMGDSIERLKKGQGVIGRASRSQLSRTSRSGPSREGSISQMEGVQFISKSPQDTSRPVTVTFDSAPDAALLEQVTYIDTLSYFCEMELEKELERMRNPQKEKPAGVKNTVLVLPKIDRKPALVRLGETHTSHRRQHKDPLLSLEYRLPPVTTRGRLPPPGQLFGFPSCVNLPLKTIYMNPFPCAIDEFDPHYQEPVLIMLKSSQKYFVPGRSHVPTESVVQ